MLLLPAGSIAPQIQADLFGTISFSEDSGIDNDEVIACAPGEVPADVLTRIN